MESPMMRSLPQSIEAEQSVIGAMIIDKSAIAQFLKNLMKMIFIEMVIRLYIRLSGKCMLKIWL